LAKAHTVRMIASGFPLDRALAQQVVEVDWELGHIDSLDLPAHTFELLNKSHDLLEHVLLFGQVLRIQRTHLG